MSEEVGLVFMNLSLLLDDICVFLRDGVNKEVFSADFQKKAETLIKRSKVQLQQISNLSNGECYMDMEEHKKEEETAEEEIYTDANEENEPPVKINEVCPFVGLPAKELPESDKCGFIDMKTKFIFGFDYLKRVYAVVHMGWFLIYTSNRDSKPTYTYSLNFHKAQPMPKPGENETQLFSLTNSETNEKLKFLALTHKDMLQWIAKINEYHQKNERQPNRIEKMITVEKVSETSSNTKDEEVSEDDEENYDIVVLKMKDNKNDMQMEAEEEEEEEIYEVIGPQSSDNSQLIPMSKPLELPSLPIRKQQTPLPPLPDENGSSESLASYDSPVVIAALDRKSIISDTASFSEEEEQEIYDELVIASPVELRSIGVQKPTYLPDPPKKEETFSSVISSLKDMKQQKEKPIPPKKLPIEKQVSNKSSQSPVKETQSLITMRKPFKPSLINNQIPPDLKGGSCAKPLPPFLTKPKIDVKLIKSSANSKPSTKHVMKLAKEMSLK